MNLEKIDRRLFLRGLTLTSAGLVVPLPIISVPAIVEPRYHPMNFGGRIIISEEAIEDGKYQDVLDAARRLRWAITNCRYSAHKSIAVPKGTYDLGHPVIGPVFNDS